MFAIFRAERPFRRFGTGATWGQKGAYFGPLFGVIFWSFLGSKFEGGLSGILGTIVEEAKKAGSGLLGAAGEAAGSGYIKRKFLLQGAASLANTIGLNVDVGQVISRTTGAVENPNLELLFQGPGLRDFAFNIRFTPRSKWSIVVFPLTVIFTISFSSANRAVISCLSLDEYPFLERGIFVNFLDLLLKVFVAVSYYY